jgi:hypothetical protein
MASEDSADGVTIATTVARFISRLVIVCSKIEKTI